MLFFILAIVIGVWRYLIVVFVCKSLVANDAKLLFMCLFCHLYILFGKMTLPVFYPFSSWIWGFLSLSFESSLYIQDTCSLSDM